MLRYLIPALFLLAPCLSALSFDDSWRSSQGLRQVALFDRAPLQGQLLDDTGPESSELLFGAGVGLSLNNRAIGPGLNGWFDIYFRPWISAGLHSGFSFGHYRSGATATSFHFALGAKFTFDIEKWEWTRWLRPWVALYPVGFQTFSVSERVSGDRVRYSDTYYYTSLGGGVDFFLTSHLAVGAGLLYYGSYGGRHHRVSGHRVRTRGFGGVHFEFARVVFRF